MARDKQAFEVKAHVNSVELAVNNREKLLRIEAGDRYETDHPDEINALADHPSVKTADSAQAKKTEETK